LPKGSAIMEMHRQPPAARILVIARPQLGRTVTAVLAAAGYEVYRSPDAAEVATTVKRLRPDLVIIALDLPWYDSTAAARLVRGLDNPVPIVLLDHAASPISPGDAAEPTGIDEPRLIETVAAFLADPHPTMDEDDCPVSEAVQSLYAACKRAAAAAGALRGERGEPVAILSRASTALAQAIPAGTPGARLTTARRPVHHRRTAPGAQVGAVS
jgi:CheY-like chemotaxis protein